MHIIILSYNLESFVVVEIAGVLKRLSCTNNWGGPTARMATLWDDPNYPFRSIQNNPRLLVTIDGSFY